MTMLLSLISVYKELQENAEDNVVSKSAQEFTELKELAKRFALSLGLDAVKNREPIIAVHRAGILFAVQEIPDDPTAAPTRLLFLEILNEFTCKLLKQDKKVVLSFLDRRIAPGMPSSRSEEWQPLVAYRNALLHGDTSDQQVITTKKAYTRRRRELGKKI